MGFRGADLPDFPWDTLEPAKQRAASHPDGIVDLSIGTPVDPSPMIAQLAMQAAADSPGYPLTIGTPALRSAMVVWWARRRGATLTEAEVLPTIGSKEFVAHLPSLLGLGLGDFVVHPKVAYPTYDVGARLAGATPVAIDGAEGWPAGTKLVWLNSPGNPHGHVDSAAQLRAVIAKAREVGAIVAADECYAELDWAGPSSGGVPSLLADDVCGGDHRGLLALYSLSKQSNLAGYRAAMVAGDADLLAAIREIRKHSGMMLPGPVQAAMAAVLADDSHVAQQRERYRRRREVLSAAVRAAGLELDPASVAGLYLWGHGPAGVSSAQIVAALAERGILAAPGSFYGPAGEGYVRMALSATDERIDAAVERLGAAPLF